MPARALLLAALLLGCDPLPPAAPAARPSATPTRGAPVIEGEVVAVHDGDTLSIRSGEGKLRVRLAQIDAPERDQPFGRRAQQALARLAGHRRARLVVVDRDEYGRTVGDLFVGELFVKEALVREGQAWAHPRYVRSARVLAAEEDARRARRGLWALPPAQREPPWEWRRTHPRSRPRGPAPPSRPDGKRHPLDAGWTTSCLRPPGLRYPL